MVGLDRERGRATLLWESLLRSVSSGAVFFSFPYDESFFFQMSISLLVSSICGRTNKLS